MDKKLNRQIGYRPDKQPSTAAHIVKWIKAHPLIAWGRMCVDLGIDKGNFRRTMQSERPSLKPEIIAKIEAVLKNYGYTVEK